MWHWKLRENTLKVREDPYSKSQCSHEDQDGNERHSASAPFPRASPSPTNQVYCQKKFKVVCSLPLIFTIQGPLDRSVSVITCVSKCLGETVVLHFPFIAWPQQWQPYPCGDIDLSPNSLLCCPYLTEKAADKRKRQAAG